MIISTALGSAIERYLYSIRVGKTTIRAGDEKRVERLYVPATRNATIRAGDWPGTRYLLAIVPWTRP
jgi:hypothetical protein